MLPSYVPNSRIYFFEWDAGFEEDAVDDILLGHADNMLADIHAMRNPTKDSDSDVSFPNLTSFLCAHTRCSHATSALLYLLCPALVVSCS